MESPVFQDGPDNETPEVKTVLLEEGGEEVLYNVWGGGYVHPEAEVASNVRLEGGARVKAGAWIGKCVLIEKVDIPEGIEIYDLTWVRPDDEGRVRLSSFLPQQSYYMPPQAETAHED